MSAERNNVHEIRGGGAPGGGRDRDRLTSVDACPTRLETVVDNTLPNLAAKGDIRRVEGKLPHLATREDIGKIDVDIQKIRVRVSTGVPGGIVLAVAVVSTLLGTFLP